MKRVSLVPRKETLLGLSQVNSLPVVEQIASIKISKGLPPKGTVTTWKSATRYSGTNLREEVIKLK